MTGWERYQRLVRDVAFEQYREERAREWLGIVRLMRLGIERDIADRPITLEDTDQMVRALTKLKHLPDLGIVL